jgi:hypothetical protein
VLALLAAGWVLVPTLVAALPRSFGPYASLMLLGFFIGICGHVFRARWLVAVGVILVMIAALLLPLALLASTDDEPPPPPRVAADAAG